MKTVAQILVEVGQFQPMTPPTLYGHLRALKIKPLGVRQCPQRYPDDAPTLILKRLGITQPVEARSKRRKAGAR